jgi:hypothetical protein
MVSMAATINACCAIIVASIVLLSAATGRRLPRLRRRLKGLKSYLDPNTVELRASVAVRDVGVEFVSTGSVDPAAAASVLNGVPAEEGGYDNAHEREDLHEREEIEQEPPSQYPIPDEINEPLSNLFGRQNPPSPLPPYSLPDVARTVPRFHDNLALLVYDPRDDKFGMHYSDSMRWTSGCKKLKTSFQMLANSLRLMFPERFDPAGQDGEGVGAVPELVISVASGDYPQLNWNQCMRDGRDDCFEGEGSLSPVLQFGSVFRAPVIPTTTLAMPMPQWNHLHCFHYWTMHRQICGYYLPRSPENREGLVFGEYLGLAYDDLIPQVVWRGTDFSYLHKLLPDLRRPDFREDVAGKVGASSSSSSRVNSSTRSAAVDAMRVIYDELIPRWRGVVLTAEAERDAERINNSLERKAKTTKLRTEQKRVRGGMVLPWCNIKFAGTMHMGKNTPAAEVEYYQKFAEYGIPAAGEAMNLETLGTYKYHIDLGGGGGTTWSGTLEKLGLPGLLFHHVTPTMDYLHELLTPWVHYVPVEADLSDLREKYEWAEAHPSLARRISQAATALAMSLGTPEGFEAMHRRFYEEPLRRVVEAYVPSGRQGGREDGGGDAGDDGIDWREALLGLGGGRMTPIMQCGGYYHHDCEHLVPDEWLKSKRRTGKDWKEDEEDGR